MRRLDAGPELDDPLGPYEEVDRTPPPGRPGPCWVLANMVGGLDGSASVGGRVAGLSDEVDRDLFRRLRSLADVVLVGAETVRREGYGPVRLPDELRRRRIDAGRPAVPSLAVVSRSLELDWSTRLFTEAEEGAPTIVLTGEDADPGRRQQAERVAEVMVAGSAGVDPAAALGALAARGARVVLTEGGPRLLGELVAADVLDELCLTLAPVMGGDALPVAVVAGTEGLAPFRLAHVLGHGSTLFLRYERERDGRG